MHFASNYCKYITCNRVCWNAYHACQRGLRGLVPASHFYVRTCQMHASYSIWHANMPKACQYFNLAWQGAKMGANFPTSPAKRRTRISSIFKEIFQFFHFSVMLNICISNFKNIWTILENLSLETKNLNVDTCKISLGKSLINLKSLTSFLNGVRGINRTIIWLV